MSRSILRRAASLLLGAAALACDSTPPVPPGDLVVQLLLAGLDTDNDGFQVRVDGGDPRNIAAAVSTVTFSSLAPGKHQVLVTGLAPNCSLDGENPRTVRITSGSTERIDVTVLCTSMTADLEVAASTTGPDPDPDGYQVRVDGSGAWPVPANGFVRIEGLADGNHDVRLEGLASNCQPEDGISRVIGLTTGGRIRDVERATFEVACSATTGVVLVKTVTTGSDPDRDGYLVQVDASPLYAVASNGSVAIPGVEAGSHAVRIALVATNCGINGENPRTTSVGAGGMTRDTARVTLEIICHPVGRGVKVSVVDRANKFPGRVYVLQVDPVCDNSGYYCTSSFSTAINDNASVSFDLPVGVHQFLLSGNEDWCTYAEPNPLQGTVGIGEVLELTFTVVCPQSGTIRVTAPTTGDDPDDHYTLLSGTSTYTPIEAGLAALIQKPPGEWTLRLLDVAPNCTVGGPNPRAVFVQVDRVTETVFPVTCQPNPTLKVTVATTGPNQPQGYFVGVDPYYYYYSYYVYTADILANGEASIRILPGSHWVYLNGLPSNCGMTSPNGVEATLVLGSTTTVAFTVVCR